MQDTVEVQLERAMAENARIIAENAELRQRLTNGEQGVAGSSGGIAAGSSGERVNLPAALQAQTAQPPTALPALLREETLALTARAGQNTSAAPANLLGTAQAQALIAAAPQALPGAHIQQSGSAIIPAIPQQGGGSLPVSQPALAAEPRPTTALLELLRGGVQAFAQAQRVDSHGAQATSLLAQTAQLTAQNAQTAPITQSAQAPSQFLTWEQMLTDGILSCVPGLSPAEHIQLQHKYAAVKLDLQRAQACNLHLQEQLKAAQQLGDPQRVAQLQGELQHKHSDLQTAQQAVLGLQQAIQQHAAQHSALRSMCTQMHAALAQQLASPQSLSQQQQPQTPPQPQPQPQPAQNWAQVATDPRLQQHPQYSVPTAAAPQQPQGGAAGPSTAASFSTTQLPAVRAVRDSIARYDGSTDPTKWGAELRRVICMFGGDSLFSEAQKVLLLEACLETSLMDLWMENKQRHGMPSSLEAAIAWLVYYGPRQVSTPQDQARERLVSGKVAQKGSTLVEYVREFQITAMQAHAMHDEDMCIALFKQGLSTELKPLCACMPDGSPWRSFALLVQHATAKDIEMRVRDQVQNAQRNRHTHKRQHNQQHERKRFSTSSHVAALQHGPKKKHAPSQNRPGSTSNGAGPSSSPGSTSGTPPKRVKTDGKTKNWFETAESVWGGLGKRNEKYPHLLNAQAAVCKTKGLCVFCYGDDKGCFKGECSHKTSPKPFPAQLAEGTIAAKFCKK
jgi:hypothetical protein